MKISDKQNETKAISSDSSLIELRWIRILLLIIALPVIVIILKTLESIFIPLIFAIFISFIFAPMRAWLNKRKVPFWLNMLLMIAVILLVFVLVGLVLNVAVQSFSQQLPKYQDRLTSLLQSLLDWSEQAVSRMDIALANIPNFDAGTLLGGGGFSLTKLVSGTMSSFMSVGSKIFLSLIFLLFIVGGSGKLEKRVKAVLSEEDKRQTVDTVLSIQTQIQKYFSNKSLISICTTASAMLIMWIFGIDFVIIAGIFYFILNFIPNIGSIISALFPITICLLQYGFGLRWVALIIFLVSNELVFANYIEPKVMSERLNLSPIMVLISLIFWGYVWGIIGMMIAVPITSSINIILKQIDKKSIISAIISDC